MMFVLKTVSVRGNFDVCTYMCRLRSFCGISCGNETDFTILCTHMGMCAMCMRVRVRQKSSHTNSLLVFHKDFKPIVTCRLQNPSLGTICRSKSGLMKWFLYRSSTCLIFLVHILYQVKIRYNDHWSVSHINPRNRPIGLFILDSVVHLHILSI